MSSEALWLSFLISPRLTTSHVSVWSGGFLSNGSSFYILWSLVGFLFDLFSSDYKSRLGMIWWVSWKPLSLRISLPDYKSESEHSSVLVLEVLFLVISLDCELPTLQLSTDIPLIFPPLFTLKAFPLLEFYISPKYHQLVYFCLFWLLSCPVDHHYL